MAHQAILAEIVFLRHDRNDRLEIALVSVELENRRATCQYLLFIDFLGELIRRAGTKLLGDLIAAEYLQRVGARLKVTSSAR